MRSQGDTLVEVVQDAVGVENSLFTVFPLWLGFQICFIDDHAVTERYFATQFSALEPDMMRHARCRQ